MALHSDQLQKPWKDFALMQYDGWIGRNLAVFLQMSFDDIAMDVDMSSSFGVFWGAVPHLV